MTNELGNHLCIDRRAGRVSRPLRCEIVDAVEYIAKTGAPLPLQVVNDVPRFEGSQTTLGSAPSMSTDTASGNCGESYLAI